MGSILVVGGAGYIGTHMVKRLLAEGLDVIVLDDLSTGHEDLLPGGDFIRGDLGDTALLDHIFTENKIDAVMHFAAFSLVGESVQKPLKYFGNNVAKTVALLDAMVRNDVDHFVFSSSAAVYGEPEIVPIDESHPCNPTNPYGASKLMVERILSECDTAHGLKSISLRYFNAAGADDSAAIGEKHTFESHLIPLVLKVATGERENIQIFGGDYDTPDGTAVRDYIHVNDLAEAHVLALEALLNGKQSTQYNLGNNQGYSVREVIACARKVTGREIKAVETGRRAGDPAVLVASSEKITRELDWQPRYGDLETIIETAWQWEKRVKKNR